MKSLINHLFVITLALLLLSGGCENDNYTIQTTETKTESYLSKESPKLYPDYEKNWKTVDSLENKGLPKSALELVNLIMERASNEQNQPMQVKALFYQLKYNQELEENEFVTALNRIDELKKTKEEPLSQLLSSIKGEMIWSYFQDNRYLFYNRSTTQDFQLGDISTWDLKTLLNETYQLYMESLRNKEKLQQISLKDFSYVLTDTSKESYEYAPTMFDFLAHRALEVFKNDELAITRPNEKFVINSQAYFGSDAAFLAISTKTEDTLSANLYYVKTMQELIRFHGQHTYPIAELRNRLDRYHFVYNKVTLEAKTEWYQSALIQTQKEFSSNPAISEVSAALADLYVALGSTTDVNSENYQLLKKAHQLCTETIKKYPNTYGAEQCKAIIHQIEQSALSGNIELYNLSNSPILIQAVFKNITTIYANVYQAKNADRNNYSYDLSDELKKLKLISSKKIELPASTDFQEHSTEFSLDQLPFGNYLVLLSTNPNNLKDGAENHWTSSFQITDLAYSVRELNNNKSGIEVTNRSTGAGISNATVTVYEEVYNYGLRKYERKLLKRLPTDANGWAEIPHYDAQYGKIIEVNKEKDVLTSSNSLYRYDDYRQHMTYSDNLFTDRSIYRPGQTVYFKGIQLKTQNNKSKIVANQSVTVTLRDVNYQEVTSLDLKSNEYGSYSGSFRIPSSGLTGLMTIQTNHGSVNFSVEEYKRPTFKVEIEKSTVEYNLDEQIKVQGAAIAYAGNAVDNSSVKYVVKRKVYLPYWRAYFLRRSPYTSASTIISEGITTTDKDGKFTIDFKAEKDPSHQTGYNYTFIVETDVTDMNGETRSASKSIFINESSIQLSISSEESMDKSKQNSLTVTTINSEGVAVPAKGTIVISRLKPITKVTRKRNWEAPDKPLLTETEFNTQFPYLDYQPMKNEDRIVEREVAKLNFNTEKLTKINLNTSTWQTGTYKIEATTTDKNGVEVKDIQFISLSDMNSLQAPFKTVLNAYSVKSVYEPGETIVVPVSSSLNNQLVLVEINYDGTIVEQKHLILSNEQKTISFKVEEEHRGGISIHLSTVRYGNYYSKDLNFTIPYSNKELQVSFETFRDKLLPGENEEWRLRISGPKKEKVSAEMLITMYDASLDAFKSHSYDFNPYPQNSSANTRIFTGFGNAYGRSYYKDGGYYFVGEINAPRLNFFGYYSNYYGLSVRGSRSDATYYYIDGIKVRGSARLPMSVARKDSERSKSEKKTEERVSDNTGQTLGTGGVNDDRTNEVTTSLIEESSKNTNSETVVPLRSNFNETAFFFPQLKTDANGDIIVTFTVPESLTSWKVLGLAHTKELAYALFQKEVITQKELMVQTNLPRFMRTGDKVTLTSKVSNLTDKVQKGKAKLQLFDALTMKEVNADFKLVDTETEFTAEPKQSTVVSWNVEVPSDFIGSLILRVSAKAQNHTDGEELTLAVLTDRVLVTESMPMTNNGKGAKEFTFEKLVKSGNSSTLQHHSVTMEYTSNPAWYVIQALPYMLEYPYECSEQIFTRFYANSIASNIVRSSPKIKDVFEQWKKSSPDAFLSNLEKNQQLKSVILEETPWVLDAKDESERKKRIALLFDFNKMDNELAINLQKLQKAQVSNGGFPWFPGMPESRYITQYIVSGMGHLNELGISLVKENKDVQQMIRKAVKYLDARMLEDYNYWKKQQEKNKNYSYEPTNLQYLYARSFFMDIKLSKAEQEAFDFFRNNTEKNWKTNNLNGQAMLALVTYRLDNKVLANDIMKSILERSITTDEMGKYWKENERGYYWYQAPIETQALIIEALNTITKDQEAINNAKIWLLRNKQTSDWKTTTATANAAYALLLGGNYFTSQSENVKIEINGKEIRPEDFGTQAEAGTGYFQATWTGKEISKDLGKVKVTRQTDGFSWGAMYWQYFESMEKVTSAETNLKLKKQLFVVNQTKSGEVIVPIKDGGKLQRGDKVRVRIELSTDRNMEFVHMKDYRAAGFEPINVLSQYKWQGGLGYYESTKDVATHFFFDYLPKGNYVFEYDLRVFHSGDFSNGFAQIECMYAPEFKSHSNGVRVVVE